ncbi:MAG TPA: insulinase family protein [Opitutaceae bacterium]|nr:insulinase family protein [Opitutaceae bacterium]
MLRSTHSLDQLESWARRYFSAIPRGTPAPLNRPRDFLPCADIPSLLRIEPLQEIRRLQLQFITDSSQPGWDAKTPALLAKLIGYEGEGSLLAALKTEGLATALTAVGDISVPCYDNFAISIELTPEGLAHTDRVLAMVFAQIELLRRSPFPLQTFHESAQLARLNETWRERGEGLFPTADLVANALRYPLAIAERIPFLWLTPDEAGYRRLLADLRPGNMLATLVARGVATDREEHHYKVKYGFDSAGMPPRSLLEDPPQVATLHLPRPNPFQPGEVALLPLEPAQLVAEPGLSLYHLQDTEFQRPLVTYVIRIRPERQILSAQDRVLSFFYQSCVLESANLVAYDAQQAGAEFDLTVDADGISLIVTGFSGSAEKCLAYFADQLRHFALDATRFAALKERTQRHLESFDRAEAVQQAAARRQALAQQFAFVPDHLAPLVATVDYSGIQAFGRSLLAHARVEALVYGNINGAAAIAGTRAFVATIGSAPPAGPVLSRQAHLVQQAGDSIVDSAAIRGSNSCCWREYEYPDDTPERRAAALLIGQFLAEPFFTELRTQQQLGYRVESQHQVDRHKLLQLLIVQSADYVPAELEKRICAFETTIGERWRSLGPEQFAVLAAGVRSTLEAKDKSGRERAERLFDLAYNFDAEWARTEATLRELEKLTPARVGETLAALFDPGSARLREVLLAGESHRGEKLPPPTFTDREAWKKTQAYR